MRQIPLQDKEKVFCLLQAREAFKWVIRTCAYIINNNLDPDDDLYHPLVVAIYVMYSRPFLANFGIGKLDTLLVPEPYLPLHKEIIDFRSKVFAHRDLKESKKGQQVRTLLDYHTVYFTKKGAVIYTQVAEERPPEENIRRIYDLASLLLEKVRYHSAKLNKKYERVMPKKDGTYKYIMHDAADKDFEMVDDIELPEGTQSSKLPRLKK
jgi:hypothetical protein